jgi:AAHS family 4-hydroxybenzoate transporter-like MFS transporter
VFGSGLFGIMLGALVGGPLADYIGRKRVIIFSAIFFGICTLITAFAGNVQQLLIIRFITGVGLGAAMPNAIALISEYSPKRHHAIMVMTMFCGFSLGAALGGLVAGLLVPAFGWSSVFIFGGIVPLLLAPVFGSHFQNPCAFFCSAIPTIRASTSSSKVSRERRPARRAL